MAVECVACGAPSNVVAYRRPDLKKRHIVALEALMGIGAIAALLTAWRVLLQTIEVADLAIELEAQFAGDTPFPDPRVRDAARLFYSTALLLFGALLTALVILPARYIRVLITARGGSPKTLHRIRRAAFLQLGIGLFSLFLVLYLFGNTETIKPQPVIGLQALVAPVVLWYSTIPAVRDHFSTYTVKRLADAPQATPPPSPPS